VLAALYLLFNEGYKASSGDRLVREELCHDAIRLTRLLAAHPATNQPATKALLALMCLNAARFRTRVGSFGEIILLHQQQRGEWDADLIREGVLALGAAATGDDISPYHLEAGIAACHCLAADEAGTDWPRILSLYDQLLLLKPTPIVAMNRSVVVARLHGPAAGLDALERIHDRKSLMAQHLYHAVRASFLASLGRTDEARAAYRLAADLARCELERGYLAAESRRI
jgi:predicted RNA polymerase sigma factor